VSEQIDRISGFAAQHFLTDTQLWASRLHPDDRAGALEAFESLLDKDTIKVEYRWQAADGRYLWFLDRAVLVRDESGEPVKIVGTWLDISERKEVEARLFTEKEFTDIALDAQVDTFFLFEPATGKALRWNRAFRDISGYTDEEIAKMPAPASYYSPGDLERAAAFTQKVLVEGTGTIELELVCMDGRRIPTEYRVSVINDDQGNPKYLISIGRDVTERKQAETEQARLLAQVQEQAQQVRQILDTVPEGVLLLDGDKQVVQANPLGKRDLVILADAQVGDALTHLGDLSLEKLLSLSPQGLWHETAADGQSFQVIARPIKAGNTPLGTPSQSGTGGWVVVIRDVTREREMQWRVQQQDRLAVIGQLAGGVAHDFNNVLTAIQGFTGLVLDELEPSDPIRADLEQVTRAADRAGMLTHQLLAFSRKQVLQPVVLDPNGAIADVEKMLRRLIGENISLHAALSPDLGQVMADPGQIEQVILNLAVNARDAMPRGGQLLLETKNVLLDEGYAQMHPGANPGAYVLLAVSDTGVGMSEQVKAHIFEPFFTTKEKTRGTGLGLATVYGIVTQSSGHIEVYSEPGVGTTFKIYLPRVDAETKAQRKPAAVDWQGTETVLLAEDDNVVRALARRSLERCGYTTLEARHADDALLVYERYRDRIDLVVTDVIMPGEMSGRDLAKRLVSLHPEIKVLYTSGYTDEAIVHHGVLEPGVAFLQKPFTPSSLAQKVREVLDAGSNPSGNTA
jgi:PAS domain S-box-containing protein